MRDQVVQPSPGAVGHDGPCEDDILPAGPSLGSPEGVLAVCPGDLVN
ncbi:hypothetical protein [Streptomyces sp. NPDC001205]